MFSVIIPIPVVPVALKLAGLTCRTDVDLCVHGQTCCDDWLFLRLEDPCLRNVEAIANDLGDFTASTKRLAFVTFNPTSLACYAKT